MKIEMNSAVLVNFSYPEPAPGKFATVRGTYNGDLIVELDEPLENGESIKVVPVEACALLPEKKQNGGKRSYDKSGRTLSRVLQEAKVSVTDIQKNKQPNSTWRFRIFVTAENHAAVCETLEKADYHWSSASQTEILCSPKVQSEAAL